ncbi:hypothetical protein K438DRAFT_1787044 [Mycena galopus ATCC 62051]|nr:hypothetical protein K438DRAFT_1787044 [Mycena galopus ATCC 62051]
MCRRTYVHIAGAVIDPKEPTATWLMEADQYTSSFRELQKAAKGLTRSFFPAFCTIKDSQHYSNNKKPVPYYKHYLMVTGYLTDFKTFLGSQVTPATGGTVPDSPALSIPSSKRGWSFSGGTKKRRISSPGPETGPSSPAAGPSSSPSPSAPGLSGSGKVPSSKA